MRKTASLLASLACAAVVIVACGSGSDRPPPSSNGDGGPLVEGGGLPDAEGEGGGGDADVPPSCRDKAKSETETDIDCGGETCARCPLGKSCLTKNDCTQGADCENKICALCHDGITNGDETDVDCGGKACGPCTVGKGCKAGPDCRSESCTNDSCACPKDMTIIAIATGGAYCIDQSEVSQGQYNKFITANVPVSTQTGVCLASNPDFVPLLAWPPGGSPGPLEFNLGLPVHYVNWCDAVAYCKWAKKSLCGTIGGGTVAPADANNAAKSAWYNACSAQGTKTYPYGAVAYDPARCNGDGAGSSGPDPTHNVRSTEFGYSANNDNGFYQVALSDVAGNIMAPNHIGCQGGSVFVYQMSGNVAEWEDSCDDATATSPCRVRGGSAAAANDAAALRCDAVRTVPRMGATAPELKDIGIRCCLY
jgi:formylglycine-generating enzyme required for sulfatase activity